MADTSEAHFARLHQRLSTSRADVFHLAHALKGEDPEREETGAVATDGGFPHSRLMRALVGKPLGVALGSAAVAATLLRPRLLLQALRLTPMLRPLLMRFVLPRILSGR